jgi:hypothetical protein
VEPNQERPLTRVVVNWADLRKAFDMRNTLVHGQDRCTAKMASPHIEACLNAAGYIDDYCKSLGNPLNRRMPKQA